MINLEENRNARNVINNRIVLPPFSCSCSNNGISRLFRTVFKVEGPDYLCYHFVWKKLPNTVTCYYDKLIFWLELKSHHLWITTNANGMGNIVSKRSAHSKTRCILILKPNTLRTQVLAHASFDSIDSSTDGKDSLFFYRRAWLVIFA